VSDGAAGRTDRPRVVVVGAGFGGLEAAKRLDALPVDVTVIDRRNHHLFQPLLYQVATAGLSPADIAYPIRAILRGQAATEVVLGEVVGVDTAARSVTLADGGALAYDYLVLAAGAQTSWFGHDEWRPAAPGLKSVEDALEIRRRVLHAFERAERFHDTADHATELTFVVVGGGPTGVEMAGAIAEIAFHAVSRDFRHIDPTRARVILLEGGERLLSSFHPSLSDAAERQLRQLGVQVRLRTMVERIDDTGVDTGEERIGTRTVVWAAGVAASPLGAATGARLGPRGTVAVGPDLSIEGHPEVFVIGDLADARSDGEPVPALAPAASQGGAFAAQAIAADLEGRPRGTFRYRDKGALATIGRSAAVAEFGRLRLTGFVAWVIWWAVHIAFLIGFRSRSMVMIGWAWSWLTFQRGARLITGRWSSSAGSSDDGG
jgi:NADH dehydrogenase